MDGSEMFVFMFSIFLAYGFFSSWWKPVKATGELYNNKPGKTAGVLLPLVALGVYFVALRWFAAPDVVNAPFWILFYILLGFACQHVAVWLIQHVFDMSWTLDVMQTTNRAAIPAYAGAFLGFALIYAGANVGDGPGWWCVIVAGALGWGALLLLGVALNAAADVFERITVERDMACGLRMGGFFLGSGIILCRASAGDWTSFESTVVEFLAGWPVIVLALVALVVELVAMRKTREGEPGNVKAASLLALVYVAFGVAVMLLLPSVLPGAAARGF